MNKMAVLCRMPTIQYSARSARLSEYKLLTSCIRHLKTYFLTVLRLSLVVTFSFQFLVSECYRVLAVFINLRQAKFAALK